VISNYEDKTGERYLNLSLNGKNYGAFTHSCSQIDNVAKNILTQEEHHKTKPFK
jgi:hypothetical protein